MKKGWKIALISVGSLLGVIIIVVTVALWLIFTPARLTSIVNKLASNFLTCENHFEQVDLTLFKTYPNVGLEIKDVVLINPYQLPANNPLASQAQANDTLVHVGSLVVGIDLKEYLSNHTIVVRQLRLDNTSANLYTSPDGWSNLDVFKTSENEVPVESEGESSLPNLQLNKIAVNNLSLQYCDLQQQMLAQAQGLDLKVKGSYLESVVDGDVALDVPRLLVDMRDSAGNPSMYADLSKAVLTLSAQGSKTGLDGVLKVQVPDGDFRLGTDSYTTQAMHDSRRDLLSVRLPFQANLDQMAITLKQKSQLSLLEYVIDLSGDVALSTDDKPMTVDVAFATNRWQVADLLAVLPPFLTSSLKGMTVDGKLQLSGTAKGEVSEGRLPRVVAGIDFTKGSFKSPKMLPYPVKDINGKLEADLNLSSDSLAKGPSMVRINEFTAKMQKTDLSVTGTVDDLMGDMLIDADIKGNINLPDLKPFLPADMPCTLGGKSLADIHVNGRLADITDMKLEKLKANGTLNFSKLDVTYDSIHAQSPKLRLALTLPAKRTSKKVAELIGVNITAGQLDVQMDNNGTRAHLDNPNLQVGLPNILDSRQALAAAFNIKVSGLMAEQDSLFFNSSNVALKGSVRNDTTQDNILKQWNPDVDIALHNGVVTMAGMTEPVRLSDFQFNYKPEVCDIARADVLWGVSDYHLSGKVFELEDWLSHRAMLHGSVNFSSNYADIDQLLSILSGMGSDADTLAQQRIEDDVPQEANPFIVPKDVNVSLNTHIGRCLAFGNDLKDLAGSVTVNDGVAVLDQIGFTCRAARMELTGIYKSPRVNHLFVGLDFHLLDIEIDELLHMVPSIDTLVPMLSAFQGKANFHLAAECNLNAFYQPKMSTLIGAAAINGKDLVVMDNASMATIAKLLQFKNWREHDNNIGIDSISVEAQVFRKEIIVYPFLLNLHNYQLCIGGRHTLTNDCNYHLELLKCPLPVRLAVDVNGKLQKPNIKLGSVQYADMYKPEKRDELQARTLELKRLVRQALEANVRGK